MCGYVILEFTMGCLNVYKLQYHSRLGAEYKNYYHCHQTSNNGRPIFAMTRT
jgi:hypothetical protein